MTSQYQIWSVFFVFALYWSHAVHGLKCYCNSGICWNSMCETNGYCLVSVSIENGVQISNYQCLIHLTFIPSEHPFICSVKHQNASTKTKCCNTYDMCNKDLQLELMAEMGLTIKTGLVNETGMTRMAETGTTTETELPERTRKVTNDTAFTKINNSTVSVTPIPPNTAKQQPFFDRFGGGNTTKIHQNLTAIEENGDFNQTNFEQDNIGPQNQNFDDEKVGEDHKTETKLAKRQKHKNIEDKLVKMWKEREENWHSFFESVVLKKDDDVELFSRYIGEVLRNLPPVQKAEAKKHLSSVLSDYEILAAKSMKQK